MTLAIVVAVAVIAIVSLLVDRGGGPRSSPGTSGTGASGTARWFFAASGPTCTAGGRVSGLPGAIDTVSCREQKGINAAFARFDSPAAAARYASYLAQAHPRSSVTGWKGGTAADRGDVVFFTGAGHKTLVWTYRGQSFVGWASTSGSAKNLDAWWTGSGRSTRFGT